MSRFVVVPNEGKGDTKQIIITPGAEARRVFLYALETGYLENYFPKIKGGGSDSYLLLMVVTGSGKIIYGGREMDIRGRQMAFLDCRSSYEIFSTCKQGWRILYLYFNGIQAQGYYEMITKGSDHIFDIYSHKTISSLFWQIISTNDKNVNYAEPLTSLNITRVLTEMCMFCVKQPVLEAEFPEYINHVFGHIARYYSEKITLDQLAELYYVNKYHLAREFKRCAGKTLNEYIITTRINRAKVLLRNSEKSVDEIAAETGFCSASHLIKHFRKHEGVTPLFYRKQWANK